MRGPRRGGDAGGSGGDLLIRSLALAGAGSNGSTSVTPAADGISTSLTWALARGTPRQRSWTGRKPSPLVCLRAAGSRFQQTAQLLGRPLGVVTDQRWWQPSPPPFTRETGADSGASQPSPDSQPRATPTNFASVKRICAPTSSASTALAAWGHTCPLRPSPLPSKWRRRETGELLVSRRFEGAGMRWTRAGTNRLPKLRLKELARTARPSPATKRGPTTRQRKTVSSPPSLSKNLVRRSSRQSSDATFWGTQARDSQRYGIVEAPPVPKHGRVRTGFECADLQGGQS